MKKIVLIPDSFKGTMSSQEICEIMEQSILNVFPDSEIISVPVADGGEGSVDAFLKAMGGKKCYVNVSGPYFETINGFYGKSGNTAIVEMAAAAGLPLVGDNLNPEKTTTYGVGELITQAINDSEIKRLIIGLGGSSTNDGGCGLAAALGVKFYNKNNEHFIPTGETLCEINKIDTQHLNARLHDIEIIAMCDIDNPLWGKDGAAAVFGPQKGADPEMVLRLDNGLLHLSKVIKSDLGKDVVDIPGTGAAGGTGAGMIAFLDAKLQMGIDVVLDIVDFENISANSDLILTGEGRIDGQSLHGKVVVGISRRAKQLGLNAIAIVGDISSGAENAYLEGLNGIFTINKLAVPYKQSKLTAKDDLAFTVENIMRFAKTLI